MVKGMFDKLGCQTTRVYDVGITEYGSPGNPVFTQDAMKARAQDPGDLLDDDTMPVTQPDLWVAPNRLAVQVHIRRITETGLLQAILDLGAIARGRDHQFVRMNVLLRNALNVSRRDCANPSPAEWHKSLAGRP